jgi:hypothetical protein
MHEQCTTPDNHPHTERPPAQPPPRRLGTEGSTQSAPPTAPRAFLEHFPQPRKSTIANWWHYAVRETCRQRQTWRENPDAVMVLAALAADLAGALAYAQSVIEYEAMPCEQRQRHKAERAFAALKEHMREKEPTTAQLQYLAVLGYCGDEPIDRAEASALIDHLTTKGGRHG